jgi:hypothetical protein
LINQRQGGGVSFFYGDRVVHKVLCA